MSPPSPSSDNASLRPRESVSVTVRGLWKERRVLGLALFCSIGGFIYGYNIGIFGGMLVMSNFRRTLPLFENPTQRGLVSAILNLGAWFGTMQHGWAAERLGRRKSITLACFSLLLGSALQTGATSPAFFFVGRFFTGVGSGAMSVGGPLYNTEISPSSIRGSVGSLFQLSLEFGTLLAFWIDFGSNYIGGTGDGQSDAAWRIPAGLQLFPIVMLAIGILFVPESPRWLVSKSRNSEALHALETIRGQSAESDEIHKEYLEILGQHKFEAEIARLGAGQSAQKEGMRGALSRGWKQWSFLFLSASNRRRVLIGVMILFFQQWNGINAIIFFAPQIFQGLGLTGTTASLLATGVIGIVMLVATIPTVLYLDRMGRKPALIGGAIAMGVCHTIIAGLSGRYQDSWESNKAAGWAACVFVWLYTIAFAMSFGPVPWVFVAEIFPLRARSKGVAIAMASSWLNAFVVSMATPSMLERLGYGTYVFFAGWCFLGAAFCCSIPETAGHTLEDMDKAFGDTDRTSEEDKARMDQIKAEIGYEKCQTGEKTSSSQS